MLIHKIKRELQMSVLDAKGWANKDLGSVEVKGGGEGCQEAVPVGHAAVLRPDVSLPLIPVLCAV